MTALRKILRPADLSVIFHMSHGGSKAGLVGGGQVGRADVVVIGAGIIGGACAYELAGAGLAVTVLDRGAVATGTSGSGEGNLLVSDKGPGPELDLALFSIGRWRELAGELDTPISLSANGGLVVALTGADGDALGGFAANQRPAGITAEPVDPAGAHELEPYLTPDLAGGMYYPQDLQLQPAKATAALLRGAVIRGATVRIATRVTGFTRTRTGAISGVETTAGTIHTPLVVNAAGPWSAAVAALAGARLPIAPRRGFILVTEALPELVRRKVYDCAYVANVTSGESTLQTSTVVEATDGGTVLIGASRERVGFDTRLRVPVLARLAAGAVRLFPVLVGVAAIRAYCGFRPYSPDHLPIIGPDPGVPGLLHATGHEGAGIGLAPATAMVVRALVTGVREGPDPAPYRADRPGLVAPGNGAVS
jgi:glycine/D-amino acid oxidase-like deaminating enzyme